MITIDGSYGEGGGQIIRTALALSIITRKPFEIERIRAGRKKPGLLAQHLTSVRAAADICRARVEGAEMGSQILRFEPGNVVPGNYTWNIGTAGSTTLVLQTVLPPLVLASGPSVLVIEGGTHAKGAPPFDFLQRAFLPLLNRMGPGVSAELVRYGFYPAGGGKIVVTIRPAAQLSPIHLESRGARLSKQARAVIASLPRHIAERELAVVKQEMPGWDKPELVVETVSDTRSPGNFVMLAFQMENVTEVFTAIGERGVSAEQVARQAVERARQYLSLDVAAGPNLADQLLVPMALAGRGSFTTGPLSLHATTNIEVLRKFLDVQIETAQLSENVYAVKLARG
ncbi:MAG TPA: RNA 3'-terminal phosphate cyclase [Methylocella sp.]|nr:RNA 3'-terminal phosphate cyclase [Methylocella sp.]